MITIHLSLYKINISIQIMDYDGLKTETMLIDLQNDSDRIIFPNIDYISCNNFYVYH